MIVKNNFFTLACLVLFISFSSCNKDIDSEETKVTTPFEVNVVEEFTGSIYGVVYDENGNPVGGAKVTTYSGVTSTDKFGAFFFKNIPVDGNGTFVHIEKNGYAVGSDMVYPHNSRPVYSSTQLYKLTGSKTFDATKETTINLENNGGSITFPANAISYEDGSAYSGAVYITAQHISPSSINVGDQMPGDLLGRDGMTGADVVLGTAGMILVELRDSNGKKLNLTSGKTAKVKMKAPVEAPANIKTWSFDVVKTRWIEEGVAQLKGGFYEFEASHFSFWNCDAPFPLIHLTGKVVNQSGLPVRTALTVTTEGLDTRYGYTDGGGFFNGKVPKGKKLTISIYDGCNTLIYSQEYGPFDSDATIPDIIINQSVISGQVVCNGQPYDDAYVVLMPNNGNGPMIFSLNETSGFNLNTLHICNATTFDIFAVNYADFSASATQNISGTNTTPLVLEVCATPCDFVVTLNKDCVSGNILEALITGGTPPFTFAWSNGTTTATLSLPQDSFQLYCVTVTDASGCSKASCGQFGKGTPTLTVQENCGTLYISVNNGTPPITGTIIGSGLQQTFELAPGSAAAVVTVSQAGVYQITIQDGSGCSKTQNVAISGTIDIDQSSVGCTGFVYNFNTTPNARVWYNSPNTIGYVQSINGVVALSTTDFGYGTKEILISDDNCEARRVVDFPSFSGLDFAIGTNPTCQGCLDGRITVTVNSSANCLRCTYGSVAILDSNMMDVTALNNQNMLGVGKYYVVVKDATTGCFIAHKTVNLQ